MPNQLNYEQNIQSLIIGEDIFRFTTPDSFLINNLYGNGFIGLDLDREFIELHLYEQNTNNLIKSVVIPLSEGYLTIIDDSDPENIEFQLQFWRPGNEDILDTTSESLLIKYLNDVPPGIYNIVINFFSDELGSYHDRKWKISKISSSRTELVIEHDSSREIDLRELSQFIDKSIFVTDFQKYLKDNFTNKEDYFDQFISLLSDKQKNILTERSRMIVPETGPDEIVVRNNLYPIVKSLLINSIFDIIYTRIDEFVDNEIINKNFRISKIKFETEIANIISTVITEYLSSFPNQDGDDSGEVPLFVNQ